jgi:hypothetical protein
MERTANLQLTSWDAPGPQRTIAVGTRTKLFALTVIASALVSAAFSSLVPLQFSVVTVFLFAGPHNLLEFRYFLTRLPVRFGKSRNFFAFAFVGIGLLTLSYLSLPVLYYVGAWSGAEWLTIIGAWNTLLIVWIAALVWMRGRQRRGRDWFWAWPVAFGLCTANWLAPQLVSLGIVYLHPLVALWFLDRQLRRSRPEWLRVYRRCLAVLPLIIAGMVWQLSGTSSLQDDNGLAWRITQHAGASILPNISSHLLVSIHVFLEMLHYIVWIVALPLLASTGAIWNLRTIPLVRHPRGFPKLIAAGIALSLTLVGLLWAGFSLDYAATRDIYFAVAIAHVLAEAPFLLRTV